MTHTKALESRGISDEGMAALTHSAQAAIDYIVKIEAQLRHKVSMDAVYVADAYEKEIEDLRTQLAERDAQLAAERAMADRLADACLWVASDPHDKSYEEAHAANQAYKATRQPTQDKGGE